MWLSYGTTALVVPENNAVYNRTQSGAFRLAACKRDGDATPDSIPPVIVRLTRYNDH